MKQTLRLRRGCYVLFDSYKRPFLYHLRVKGSRLTVISAIATFAICIGYATAPSLLLDNQSPDPFAQKSP